jgi:hypothetical protein
MLLGKHVAGEKSEANHKSVTPMQHEKSHALIFTNFGVT